MEIISGKGKEWSEVAREIEALFAQWLDFSGLSELEFAARLASRPIRIEERVTYYDGSREVAISAGFRPIGAPLVWDAKGTVSLEDFHCETILLLFCMAGRCGDKSFEAEVRRYAAEVSEGGTGTHRAQRG